MIRIEDIGRVVCACDAEEETILREVCVISVPEMETFKACLKCKARVEPMSTLLGRCSKTGCTMLQRFDICREHTTAKLIIQYQQDRKTAEDGSSLCAQEKPILCQIFGEENELTQEMLLIAPIMGQSLVILR